VARRNYEVANAGVKEAQKSFEDTKLVAPFTGLVAKTLVENHQNIQAKQPILILQDDSSLEMVVDIPESDYARLEKNISLSELTRILKPQILVTTFPDKRFEGKFMEAAATADEVTRTFEITLGFNPPSDISILPGMTARLLVTGSMEKDGSTIMIPAKAVLSDEKKNAIVWLKDSASNAVKQQAVEIGEMSGQDIIITNGLKAGDIIAGSGIHQLREGMIVRRYYKK
jgi:RND family efflux transporter MFP subunit